MDNSPEHFRQLKELISPHWIEGQTPHGIHYFRTGGNKPAIMLLHGFMANGASWLSLATTLEEDYDLVMPDLRGHGQSVRFGDGYSIPVQAEDMALTIRDLALENPAIIGHSNGALVAVYLAALHPELVRAIVLEDPPFGSGVPAPDITDENNAYTIWYKGWLAWLHDLKNQTHEKRILSSLPRWALGIPLVEEDFVPWVEAQADFDLSLYDSSQPQFGLPPWRNELPRVTCPIFLSVATKTFGRTSDPSLIQDVIDRTKAGQVQVEHFETGHFIHAEQPAHFVEVVKEFLAVH